jgi:hypothetical protein
MADTLLATLVRQRRLTQDETIDALRRRAKALEIPENRFDLSVRQLQRWVAGQVRLPHPVQCRVLEAEFRHPVEELLAPPPRRDRSRHDLAGPPSSSPRLLGVRRASAAGAVEHR